MICKAYFFAHGFVVAPAGKNLRLLSSVTGTSHKRARFSWLKFQAQLATTWECPASLICFINTFRLSAYTDGSYAPVSTVRFPFFTLPGFSLVFSILLGSLVLDPFGLDSWPCVLETLTFSQFPSARFLYCLEIGKGAGTFSIFDLIWSRTSANTHERSI